MSQLFRKKWFVVTSIFILLLTLPPLIILIAQAQNGEPTAPLQDNDAVIEADQTDAEDLADARVPDAETKCAASTCAGGGAVIASLKMPLITRNENSLKNYSYLYIGAPPSDRLRQIFKWEQNDQARGFKLGEGIQALPAAFKKSFGDRGAYFTSSNQTWKCDDDILFDGEVYLQSLKIKTTGNCHIYSTKAIFVSGPLAVDGGEAANFQMVSAVQVVLGLAKSPSLSVQKCGEADENCGANPKPITYKHLLVVAPEIRILSAGQFEGVTVSEAASIPRDHFEQKFDVVFAKPDLQILPLLENADYFVYQSERSARDQ